MTKSNTSNGGNSYFNLTYSLLNDYATSQNIRCAIYLTSLNVIDSVNKLAVSGSHTRSEATLALNGVYSNVRVWYQDKVISKTRGATKTIDVAATWKDVEYWGITLSASEDYTLPAYYENPTAPGTSVGSITINTAKITLTAPTDNGGASITEYAAYVLSNSSYPGSGGVIVDQGAGTFTADGLSPGVVYYYTARAKNSAGLWSPYTTIKSFRTLYDTPSAPGTSVDSITPTNARIVVTASSYAGGSTISLYEAYILSNNAYPDAGGTVVDSATGGTFTSTKLLPATTYYYTARAKSAAGIWSPWTTMKSFDTLPAVMVNVDGVWKNAIPYVKVSGVWKQATPYVKVDGVWELA